MNKNEMKNRISLALKDPILQQGFEIICKNLETEKKLNAEIKARFVKCNTCTDEMKSKCLMFSENLCQGERCEEFVDLMSLINKTELEKENAGLRARLHAINLLTPELEKQSKLKKQQLTKAKEIIKNLMVFAEMDCREYEEAYKEAEQFLKEE